jgi:DNA-binding GntR family transcriptional regulator
MSNRPACEAAIARHARPSLGIRCWACNSHHATLREVAECHADLYDYERERDAEAYAEAAWSDYRETDAGCLHYHEGF